jgi:GNAT superfamily N-acetyltransferase
MDIRLWRQNVDLCPELVLPASFVAEEDGAVVGVIVAKAPAKICCLIVSPAFHRHGIGSLLLQAAADVLATSGAERIILGQDLRHFFPGVPECLTSARKFFARRGFQWGGGYANDLMRSLADYTMPESVLTAISGLAARGISIQPCRDQHVPSLLKHVHANFSARWLTDTRHRLEVEPTAEEIMVAVNATGDVIGFSHTFSNQSHFIGPSVLWRGKLTPRFGGLGPIGVDVQYRKIGLGLALLACSVDRVKSTDADQMVIDWTELVEFYGKLGFAVCNRYAPMSRPVKDAI